MRGEPRVLLERQLPSDTNTNSPNRRHARDPTHNTDTSGDEDSDSAPRSAPGDDDATPAKKRRRRAGAKPQPPGGRPRGRPPKKK